MMSPTIEYVEPSTADRDFSDPEQVRSYFDAQNIAIAETIHELMQYANNPDFILIDGQTLVEYLASGQACPIGMIAAFYTTWDEALGMRGWRICDGRNGTPQIHPNPDEPLDETNIARFIRASGWGEDVTDGATKRKAGSANHRHKIETDTHTHTVTVDDHAEMAHAHNLSAANTTVQLSFTNIVEVSGGSHAHCCTSTGGCHGHTCTFNDGGHTHGSGTCSGTDDTKNVQGCSSGGTAVSGSGHSHTITGAGSHSHTVTISSTTGEHTHALAISGGTHSHTCTFVQGCASVHTHAISGAIDPHQALAHTVHEVAVGIDTYTQGPSAPSSGSDTTCANYPPYAEVIFMLRVKE